MLAYLPRISFGILKNLVTRVALTDWHTQTFRAWPVFDSDDFSMMAASKYLEFSAVAGWTHAYMSQFLKHGLKEKWFVVNRRNYLELYRPIKLLKPFIVKTKLIAFDKFSTIRLVEFYQNNKLCAQTYSQHVVIDKNLKKIPTVEWVKRTSHDLKEFGPYPDECLSWKYGEEKLQKSPTTVKKKRPVPLPSHVNP